ncbi:MAG: hypothetical protein ACR2Q3_08220 [Woeseiaceae bacterium]
MDDSNRRLNILLIEDSPRRLKLVRVALENASTRCRLHTVGANADALKYLRREAHFADAPRPDLVLLDFSQPDGRYLELIKEFRKAEEFGQMPFALLTRPETEEILEEQFESTGTCAVFSPIELGEFLQTMNSRRADRFVNAVSLMANLGILLVRAPGVFADATTAPPVAHSM